MWTKVALAGLLAVSLPLPAAAQNTNVRIYGPILTVEGNTVTVENRDGRTVSFFLAPTGRIVSDQPVDVNEIKSGDFITIDEVMGQPIQAHTQTYVRGANAPAHRQLRTNPQVTRYLGVVTAAKPDANGVKVTVALESKGGTLEAELTNNIVHYRNETENTADLKPGLIVMTDARRAGGKLVAGFTTVEKLGHKPIDIGG